MKLKLIVIYCVLLVPVAFISFCVGVHWGMETAYIEDFKVYGAALNMNYNFPPSPKIELQDFLKARYYYMANRIPEDWMGSPYDYGPVDFHGIPISKATGPAYEYQLFKQKKVRFRTPATQP